MKISANFLVRILGMVILAYLGASIGTALSRRSPSETEQLATQLLMLAGAGLGLLTTHRWTIVPLNQIIAYVRRISITELTALVFGSLLGLVFALLLAVPLSYLPAPFGSVLPILMAAGLAYFGARLFVSRRAELAKLLQSSRQVPAVLPQQLIDTFNHTPRYLVDTSAIIDGRIASVCETGFLEGTMIVPHFVLAELQSLADSADDARRAKGRRGLEILNEMQKEAMIPVEILDVEVNGTQQVDDKLVILARQYHYPIVTNDYNLGRVAGLQGVKVMNLNQLADAVRPPVVTGQDIHVVIRDVGREREQGISFLEDGTMIVVEDARRLVGQKVSATVTRVYQTQTGRIVFAHLQDTSGKMQGSVVKPQDPKPKIQDPGFKS